MVNRVILFSVTESDDKINAANAENERLSTALRDKEAQLQRTGSSVTSFQVCDLSLTDDTLISKVFLTDVFAQYSKNDGCW